METPRDHKSIGPPCIEMSGEIDRKKVESLYMEMSVDNDQKKKPIKATVSSSKIIP